MSLLNPGLLLGLGVVVIPILLHLLLKAQPRAMVFPALRLLRSRKESHRTRMRLKHFWLLLLRVLALGVLAIAVLRPTLPPANYNLISREWWTFAGIAVCVGVVYEVLRRRLATKKLPVSVRANQTAYLRMSVFGTAALLLLLFVGWPYGRRLSAEITTPTLSTAQQIPVAAVFLFDVSASMDYQLEGRNRLAVAQAIAQRHLEKLPPGSKVAIAESSLETPPVFLADLLVAQSRLESLKVKSFARPLNDGVRSALLAQLEDRERISKGVPGAAPNASGQDRFVRELYVLTDLARSAWSMSGATALREQVAGATDLGLYVIDVGIENPTNAGLGLPQLPAQSVIQGSSVAVAINVRGRLAGDASAAERAAGAAGAPKPAGETGLDPAAATSNTRPIPIDLYLASATNELTRQAQTSVIPSPTGDVLVQLPFTPTAGPFVSGEIRIVTGDPLMIDNSAFFTIRVDPPKAVLVVAPTPSVAELWMEALAPDQQVRESRAKYRPKFARPAELGTIDLSQFSAVCLLNVPGPTDAQWQRLAAYVNGGGALLVSLGAPSALGTAELKGAASADQPRINPVSYGSPVARTLLPAVAVAPLRFAGTASLEFSAVTHPVSQRLEKLGALSELPTIAIRRYWGLDVLSEATVNATTVATFSESGGKSVPAIVQRSVGDGRVWLFASALDGTTWNDLPRSWVYVALADIALQYLTTNPAAQYNARVGEDVVFPIAAAKQEDKYLVRRPDMRQTPIVVAPGSTSLVVTEITKPGRYEVEGPAGSAPFRAVFSANLPDEETNLTRLAGSELDSLLGEKRYQQSRDLESLERTVATARLGQEVSGIVLTLLLLVFVGEHLVANWFYAPPKSVGPVKAE